MIETPTAENEIGWGQQSPATPMAAPGPRIPGIGAWCTQRSASRYITPPRHRRHPARPSSRRLRRARRRKWERSARWPGDRHGCGLVEHDRAVARLASSTRWVAHRAVARSSGHARATLGWRGGSARRGPPSARRAAAAAAVKQGAGDLDSAALPAGQGADSWRRATRPALELLDDPLAAHARHAVQRGLVRRTRPPSVEIERRLLKDEAYHASAALRPRGRSWPRRGSGPGAGRGGRRSTRTASSCRRR